MFPSDRKYKRKYCDACVEDRVWVKEHKIHTQCGYCGKDLYVIPSRFETNQYCYCNAQCMSNHYAEIYSGENSPTWKGGKSHHYIGDFYHQRQLARARDNQTCQLCGISEHDYGHELSVHHLKLYREFDDKIAANDLENLVSLCEPCHRFVHSNKNTQQLFLIQ